MFKLKSKVNFKNHRLNINKFMELLMGYSSVSHGKS